jgi:hypothetical protein
MYSFSIVIELQNIVTTYACLGIHGKYPLFLFDFNQIWILSTDFIRSFQFQVSRKSVKWEPSCLLPADGLDTTEIKDSFSVCDNASSGNFLPTFRDNQWILGP